MGWASLLSDVVHTGSPNSACMKNGSITGRGLAEPRKDTAPSEVAPHVSADAARAECSRVVGHTCYPARAAVDRVDAHV